MEKPDKPTPVLDLLRQFLAGTLPPDAKLPMMYPPTIAQTLGFELVEIDYARSVIQIRTSTKKHANPMGTIHGGVLGDVADAAIGTAHATTLDIGESFTSIDLRINFFRPVWDATLRATAEPVHLGKTISYYECKIIDEQDRLVAMVSSSVATLRGEAAKGR
jgi:uncharacterized protein (TIGR00369 family)